MLREELDQQLDLIESAETITADEAKEAILKFLEFLESKIDNEKIDDFLNKIEEKIEEDHFGIFSAVFGSIKASILKNKI